jgi:GH15 family glucan-1,4-alpha-glucosidase
VLPLLGEQAQERLRLTKQWWREWNGRSTYSGPYRDMVQRSATMLQLLSYCLSGAIVAAPTTSLPESLGADRNWDYRYCWLRDAGMTAGALTGLGYHAEARAFVSWLLHATRLSWPELRIDYDVYGRERQHEEELSHLTGHRNSRPVRIGNAAGRQLQLDVYGETVIAADIVASAGMRLDPVEGRMLKGLGLSVCRQWQCPDNGIWEIRSAPRHYTLSKAMCWAALDRLISMDDRGLLVLGRYKKQFEATRDSIRQAIEKRSFNRALQHYTSEFEGDQVDASLLLLPRIGYIDAGNARMRATFRRIQDDLGTGSLLRRYQTGYDGSKTVEGAFVICNFWAVDNLALSGQVEEAARLFETILDHANDLGLFAEEIDLESGKALGNFPQAFSHVGLINAALTLQKCGWR